MLFLLDLNVLIQAHEDYYPLDRMRPFWTWQWSKRQQVTQRCLSRSTMKSQEGRVL